MSFKKRIQFIMKNPNILSELYLLRNKLSKNKVLGKYNFIFQCDVPMHFNYLEPYYRVLKSEKNIEIYFSGHFKNNDTRQILINCGVPSSRIIDHIELVKNTEWDVLIAPTSWGIVFPKNADCARIQIFHTLADKKIQYGENLLAFNIIFVCGPIHHELLEKYLFGPLPRSRECCKTYNVGYAKIDELLNNRYCFELLKKKLNIPLDDKRKIILYAPNWEKTSALHKYGKDIFEILKNTNYIVLIKLHYMSLLEPEDEYATGGVDWNALLREYEHFKNIRIIREQNINPYLALSDLLITDYGGVALEYMCTEKPTIYLDCPEFFEMRGKDIIEYYSRDTGYILDNPEEIPKAIALALKEGEDKKRSRREFARKLLFNPGTAAQAAKEIILDHILKEIIK